MKIKIGIFIPKINLTLLNELYYLDRMKGLDMNYQEIQNKLEQFIGTQEWHPVFVNNGVLPNIVETDGVRYFRTLNNATRNIMAEILREIIYSRTDDMQFIKIKVEKFGNEHNRVIITSEPDLNEPPFWTHDRLLVEKELLPEGEYKIWYADNTLLLPSEY